MGKVTRVVYVRASFWIQRAPATMRESKVSAMMKGKGILGFHYLSEVGFDGEGAQGAPYLGIALLRFLSALLGRPLTVLMWS